MSPPFQPWDDGYDDDDDSPEAALFRVAAAEEEREQARVAAALRALDNPTPREQGRRAAQKMWEEIQARLRTFNVGRRYVTITRRPYG